MNAYGNRLLKSFWMFKKLNLSSVFQEITFFEFSLLSAVKHRSDREKGNIGITTVAQILQVSPPAVSRALKSLEEKNLITRSINKEDRRNIYVETTQEGNRILAECEKILCDIFEKVYEKMGDEEIENLSAGLEQLFAVTQEALADYKK